MASSRDLLADEQRADPSAEQHADVVIEHGNLFTPAGWREGALAIRGERIVAVGSAEEVQKFIGPRTRRLDARAAAVTPGINDAHVHFLSGSLSLFRVDLTDAESLAQVEEKITAFAAEHPNDPWVIGRGWQYGTFAGGLPHKDLLDRLVPDRPAVMRCYDGHTAWVNSRALAAAGITGSTADPAGGAIVRDASGEPTGVLKETAQALLDKVLPQPTRRDKLEALRQGIATAHRLGVTSVQDAGVGLEELDLFEELRAAEQLPLRIAFALETRPKMTGEEIDRLHALKARFAKLHIEAVKLFVDGVVEAHTALLLAPYANRPTLGLPETNVDDLNRMIAEFDRREWQIMVHAIGDGGIRMTLDAMERAAALNTERKRPRRHRLEHIESISSQDIPRFGRLGVIASMQPYHANPNSNTFQVWAANLGPDRASRAWVWKSIHDAGGRLAFGSDWPVVGLDPRLGMHTALTRQTLGGEPPGGFLPEQRLSLETVLEAYTSGSAYAEYAEEQKGTLAAGMLADVIVWSDDLAALPVERVHTASVVTTIFGGRVVFQAAAP
ncbi:MAG: amidohydrolase [Aureliella sp.]